MAITPKERTELLREAEEQAKRVVEAQQKLSPAQNIAVREFMKRYIGPTGVVAVVAGFLFGYMADWHKDTVVEGEKLDAKTRLFFEFSEAASEFRVKATDEVVALTKEIATKSGKVTELSRRAVEDALQAKIDVSEANQKVLELKSLAATSKAILTATNIVEEVGGKLADDPKILELIEKQASLLPVGTIVSYWGETPPDGWLICDGGDLGTDDKFAKLRKLLGPASENKIPDLRGMFLRGLDSTGEIDKDRLDRIIGSKQASANKLHEHFLFSNHQTNIRDSDQLDKFRSDKLPNEHVAVIGYTGGDSHYAMRPAEPLPSAGRSGISGESESRPINVAVNFIIKY